MLIYVVNFVDRQVVSILAEPIKRDLHLADWQLGLMTGLAFAVLYTVLGLPIARVAERGDRPLIIAAPWRSGAASPRSRAWPRPSPTWCSPHRRGRRRGRLHRRRRCP
jgi:hypothetical protein